MTHSVSGQATNYTWDTAAGLPVVLKDNANTYVYGRDLISATDAGGAQTYFVYDGLGSTTAITDGSGATMQTYSYQVFGTPFGSTGTNPNYWRFAGEQVDTQSGLYYLRDRNYDPATGRFLQRDPVQGDLRNPQTQNRYPYVTNDPVNLVDPTGRCHNAPLVQLEGEKKWRPAMTEQDRVGLEEFGDCTRAHECDLAFGRCADSCEKRFSISRLCVADIIGSEQAQDWAECVAATGELAGGLLGDIFVDHLAKRVVDPEAETPIDPQEHLERSQKLIEQCTSMEHDPPGRN